MTEEKCDHIVGYMYDSWNQNMELFTEIGFAKEKNFIMLD